MFNLIFGGLILLLSSPVFAMKPSVFGESPDIEEKIEDVRFGERIPISSPGVIWRHVDYRAIGRGLPIEVARVYKPGMSTNMEFGSFEADYPKLVYPAGPNGLNKNYNSLSGEYTEYGCKNPLPDDYSYSIKHDWILGSNTKTWSTTSEELFSPISLHYKGDVITFHKKKENTKDYPAEADLISKNHWYIVCGEFIPSESIVGWGHGIITVVSPDGIRHRFNSRDGLSSVKGFIYEKLALPGFIVYSPFESSDLNENKLYYDYEDRNAHTSNYKQLAGIKSSDGREISFEYTSYGKQHLVDKVVVHGQDEDNYTLSYDYSIANASVEHDQYCEWYEDQDPGTKVDSDCKERSGSSFHNYYLSSVVNNKENIWNYGWDGPEMALVSYANGSVSTDFSAWSVSALTKITNKDNLTASYLYKKIPNKIYNSNAADHEIFFKVGVSKKTVSSLSGNVETTELDRTSASGGGIVKINTKINTNTMMNREYHFHNNKNWLNGTISKIVEKNVAGEEFVKKMSYKKYHMPVNPQYPDKIDSYIYDNAYLKSYSEGGEGYSVSVNKYGFSTSIEKKGGNEFSEYKYLKENTSYIVPFEDQDEKKKSFEACLVSNKKTPFWEDVQFMADNLICRQNEILNHIKVCPKYEDYIAEKFCSDLIPGEEKFYKLGLIDVVALEDSKGDQLVVSDYDYDKARNLIRTNYQGVITTYDYFENGSLKRKIKQAPDGDVKTSYYEYFLGKPGKIEVASELVETRKFDGFGNVVYFKAEDGIEYDQYYDEVLRIERVDYLNSSLFDVEYKYGYDDAGIPEVIKVQGDVIENKISDGFFTKKIRTVGKNSLYQNSLKNKKNDIIFESIKSSQDLNYNYGSNYKNYIYDGLGRKIKDIQWSGNHSRSINISYDGGVREGFIGYAVTDYDGEIVEHKQNIKFGFFDRDLAEVKKQDINKGLSEITELSYDDFGRLNYIEKKKEISGTEESSTFELIYDQDYTNNIFSIKGSDGYSVQYGLTSGGLVMEEIRGGVLYRNFLYDKHGRVNEIYGYAGNSIYFDYYLTGDLKYQKHGDISYDYTYMDNGKLDGVTLTTNEQVLEYSQQYDGYGDLETISYPSGNSYSVSNNRLHESIEWVEGVIDEVKYTSQNEIDTLILANRVSTKYTYDIWNRLHSKRIYNNIGDLVNFELNYFDDNNIKSIIDKVFPNRSINYKYDYTKKIIEETSSNDTKSYGYNNCDLLISKGDSISEDYNCSRREIDFNDMAVTYGNSGEILESGNYTYIYGQFSHLLSYGGYEYVYDGNSYPTEVKMPTLNMTYLRNPEGEILAAYESNTNTHKDIIRLDGEIIAERVTTEQDENNNDVSDYDERTNPNGSHGTSFAAILVPIISLILN